MYRYLNICSDPNFVGTHLVARIRQALDSLSDLVQKTDHNYSNAENSPWISVGIINCSSEGNYPAGLSQTSDTANLVEFICMDDGSADNDAYYQALAFEVANQLGWIVVEDGEGITLFDPRAKAQQEAPFNL